MSGTYQVETPDLHFEILIKVDCDEMCVFPHVFLSSPDPINMHFVNLSARLLS